MATADIFYHLGKIGENFAPLLFRFHPESSENLNSLCSTAWTVFCSARLISVTHELFIAIYCLTMASLRQTNEGEGRREARGRRRRREGGLEAMEREHVMAERRILEPVPEGSLEQIS